MVSVGLGLVAALLVLAVLTGRRLPLLSGDRAALVALVVIGMAICSGGIGRVAAAGQWMHPLAMLSYVVGSLILVVAGAGLLHIRLPLVADARAAFVAVTVMAAFKVTVSMLHRLL